MAHWTIEVTNHNYGTRDTVEDYPIQLATEQEALSCLDGMEDDRRCGAALEGPWIAVERVNAHTVHIHITEHAGLEACPLRTLRVVAR